MALIAVVHGDILNTVIAEQSDQRIVLCQAAEPHLRATRRVVQAGYGAIAPHLTADAIPANPAIPGATEQRGILTANLEVGSRLAGIVGQYTGHAFHVVGIVHATARCG